MYPVSKATLAAAHKPFDLVTDKHGNVGFVQEVNVNEHQEEGGQISYAVHWLIGSETKVAWFGHSELTAHKNLLIAIAECACNPRMRNQEWVRKIFSA